jgi:hypothetical protein
VGGSKSFESSIFVFLTSLLAWRGTVKERMARDVVAARKTFKEKLHLKKDIPKVVPLTGKSKARFKADTMVVPAPLEIDELMRKVRKGKLITTKQLRQTLAHRHDAQVCCPLVTGIAMNLSAHAAEEEACEGKKRITPWWRTLKTNGELNPKFPGGLKAQAKRLQAEGHRITKRGKRWYVTDFVEP